MGGYNLLPSIDREGSNHQSVGRVLIFYLFANKGGCTTQLNKLLGRLQFLTPHLNGRL